MSEFKHTIRNLLGLLTETCRSRIEINSISKDSQLYVSITTMESIISDFLEFELFDNAAELALWIKAVLSVEPQPNILDQLADIIARK